MVVSVYYLIILYCNVCVTTIWMFVLINQKLMDNDLTTEAHSVLSALLSLLNNKSKLKCN